MESNTSCSNVKRTTNFTKSEENHLVQLIKKYGHILENKKTDSGSNHKKSEAWLQITREFNSSGNTYRSLSILKNKYANLKKKTVKTFSNEKRDTYLTGGGPHVPTNDTEMDRDLREILGSRTTGLGSVFDHDLTSQQFDSEKFTVIIEQSDESDNEFEREDNGFLDEGKSEETEMVFAVPGTSRDAVSLGTTPKKLVGNSNYSRKREDWSKSSVDSLRTPVSKNLQVGNPNDTRKRDNTLKTKLSSWAKCKQDYVSIQHECCFEEHKQKLKHNEEKHQEALKKSRQEFEQDQEIHGEKMKIMKEEHEIKMSILKLEKQCILKKVAE